MEFKGLILAGGRGSRFNSNDLKAKPKVLRHLLGKPLIQWVIDSLKNAGVYDTTIVVGYKSNDIINELGDGYNYIFQKEQKGSGDAVAYAKEHFEVFKGSVIIMCGDSPLFTSETLKKMMNEHEKTKAVITLASSILENPIGYGRIIRDKNKNIKEIIEEKCADNKQKEIKEVNGGAYIFDSKWMFDNIHLISKNQVGEYNLTDLIRIASSKNEVIAYVHCDSKELLGVNTPSELKKVEHILKDA